MNTRDTREDKLAGEINALITSIHKSASESLREQVQSYARKVFGGAPGRPITDSPAELQEKITARVGQLGDQRSVLSCQDLSQRFLNTTVVYRKQEVLRMLFKLSELNSQEETMTNIFQGPRKQRDLNATIETNASVINTPPMGLSQLARPQRTSQSLDQLKLARSRGSTEQNLSESDLVRQLLFVLGNTTSADIIDTGDGYQVRATLVLSEPVRRMVADISELGWLHKRILNQSDKPGTLGKALKLAVTEELNQYYRWIGSMETLAKLGRLSLRKLVNWSFQPELIMRHLSLVLEAIGPFEGVHIISIVNSFRPSGLAPVQALLDRLVGFLIQPLLNYIHNWVYLGQLLDSRGQFFIGENSRVSQSQQWSERFRLLPQCVPNVLEAESAKMIFNAGKTIFFLRNRCKVIYEVKARFPQGQGDRGALGKGFTQWLQEVHTEVGAQLVSVLRQQFHLKQHLQSMKHFFLCGKGDFIQHLYDSLREKLSHKKHEISQHSLDGYISDAIGKCFSDSRLGDKLSYRGAILDRLLAKKIDYGGGGQGWDCFNLQYSLQRLEPMQALLSPETMMNYQKIFFFLWRVKQIEEVLKAIWAMQSKDDDLRMLRECGQGVEQLFQYCYMLRHSMNHFLTNLHSYLMISMEGSWTRFAQALDHAPTFDQVLKLHRDFQQEILETTLNTPKGKQISLALNNLFTVINNFKMVWLRLQESFDLYSEDLRLYRNRKAMMEKGYIKEDLALPEFASGRLLKDIRELRSCFDTAFKNFFSQVRKEGETKLSVLSFKLDYSQYYSTRYDE